MQSSIRRSVLCGGECAESDTSLCLAVLQTVEVIQFNTKENIDFMASYLKAQCRVGCVEVVAMVIFNGRNCCDCSTDGGVGGCGG